MTACHQHCRPDAGLVQRLLARRDAWCDWLTAALAVLSALGAAAMAITPGLIHGNDFKHLWLGARLLAQGRDPYDFDALARYAVALGWPGVNPFVYLPTTGLMMQPLAQLDFERAQAVWFAFNWTLAWATVLAGPSWMGLPRPAWGRLAGAVLLAGGMPFWRQMSAGQMNVVAAALLTLAAGALARRRDALAGAALALGFAWKIAPALLGLAVAALGRRRAAAWGAGLGAAAILLSLALYGLPIHRTALRTLGQMGYGRSTAAEAGRDFYRDPANQSLNALFHRLLTQNPYSTPWAAWGPRAADGLTWLASVLIVAAWVAALRRARRAAGAGRLAEDGVQRLYAAAVIAMLLVPSLLWDHYVVQALPALMWLFGSGRAAARGTHALGVLLAMAALIVPVAHYAESWRSGAGILVQSLRLWPLLALYGWLLTDPSRREPQA